MIAGADLILSMIDEILRCLEKSIDWLLTTDLRYPRLHRGAVHERSMSNVSTSFSTVWGWRNVEL